MALTKTLRSLTLEGAHQAIHAATGKAGELGVPVCVAVVDQAGVLLAFERLDGAPALSIQLAQDKAYTVTAFGLPTRQWYPLIADEPALLHGIVKADRLMIFGGGAPVTVDGQIVGAVGVSGGSAEQDDSIASTAAAALSN
jgi:uncharacterized protein GlcG (DUF336 family)